MWSRKRLDIGWSDLLFGVWHALFRPNSEAIAARIARLWPEPERMFACLSVRSGFDLLLEALSLPQGSEVLVSAITIPDMIRILERHGLTPVPVDLDPETAAPTLETWEKAVTPKTRAILAAHLFGGRMPMEPLVAFARRRGLFVIEDCAQAFAGVEYAGYPEADASMFSFGVIKCNTALGGAVLNIRDREILAKMHALQAAYPEQNHLLYLKRLLKYGALKILSSRPMCGLFVRLYKAMGGNYDRWINAAARGFSANSFFDQIRRRPSSPLLAVLERRLRKFDPERWRQHIAKGNEMLSVLRETDAPRILPVSPGAKSGFNTFWVFPVLVDEPDRLIDELSKHGFDATQGQSLCVVSAANTSSEAKAPCAESMLNRIVFLPFYPELPLHEARRLSDIVRNFS
jgi:dTDP-4-amino-4,6-dideoxygalactose transaminase